MNSNQIKEIVTATLTREDVQCLQSQHSIDAEFELTKILNKQINHSVRKYKVQNKIKNFFDL